MRIDLAARSVASDDEFLGLQFRVLAQGNEVLEGVLVVVAEQDDSELVRIWRDGGMSLVKRSYSSSDLFLVAAVAFECAIELYAF